MQYTDEELFDFTADEDSVVSENHEIPDELSDFIADFDKTTYNTAIEMFRVGMTVEEIVAIFSYAVSTLNVNKEIIDLDFDDIDEDDFINFIDIMKK